MISKDTLVYELTKGKIPAHKLKVGDKILSGEFLAKLSDETIVPVCNINDYTSIEGLFGRTWLDPILFVEVLELSPKEVDSYYDYNGYCLTGNHVFLEGLLVRKPISQATNYSGEDVITQVNEKIVVLNIKTKPLKPNTSSWFKLIKDDESYIAVSGEGM